MSIPEQKLGRVSPNSYYKNKKYYQNLEKKEKKEKQDKSGEINLFQNGRKSPNKFVFTLQTNTQTNTQSNTQVSKQSTTKVNPNLPPRYKSNHIKPVLTLQELENTQNNSTPSTLPINIINNRNRNSSNYTSLENSPDNSPMNSPPHIIDLLIDNIIAEGKEVEQDVVQEVEQDVKQEVVKEVVQDVVQDVVQEVVQDVETNRICITNSQKISSFSKYQYYSHLKIINILKNLVFQNKGLICGSFNSQQLIINEYTKSFMNQIKFYNTTNNFNNFNVTDEQINNLFTNDLILPETKERLKLQLSMEILISYSNFISFIDTMKHYFDNDISVKTYYKLEYINKGNMKDNIDKSNDLYLYNTNGNQIYLYIVKIFDIIYNTIFEVKFIVLYNETVEKDAKGENSDKDKDKDKDKDNNPIALCIPPGLYQSEHLHITNNGNDVLNIQYSSSSLEYIVNNMNMKIISLLPKLNDYNYTKISKYIYEIMKCYNEYLFEFDIYNTIHKKSDFWLCNVQIEKEPKINTVTHTERSKYNILYCNKCNIVISKNTKYVIAKCCNKEYHIECMEINYYQSDFYTYLLCDCGCNSIDENSCNNRLLMALYKNYY
jgi:hypothetical protein